MFCDIQSVMESHEQYARGWIRLYANVVPDSTCAEMAKYACDLTKLKRAHMEQCPACKENESRNGLSAN